MLVRVKEKLMCSDSAKIEFRKIANGACLMHALAQSIALRPK